jgi:hypothetical protein
MSSMEGLHCFNSVSPNGIKSNDCEGQSVPCKLKGNNMFHFKVIECEPLFEPTEYIRAFGNEAFAHGR